MTPMRALLSTIFERLAEADWQEVDQDTFDCAMKDLDHSESMAVRALAVKLRHGNTKIITIKD